MKNNTELLDNARNLGYSIIQSQEYKNLLKSEEDYYNDLELTVLLKELKNAEGKDKDELQDKINRNKSMINYISAKDKYNEIFNKINNLITYITDGQSRPLLEVKINNKDCNDCSGCSGGCSK